MKSADEGDKTDRLESIIHSVTRFQFGLLKLMLQIGVRLIYTKHKIINKQTSLKLNIVMPSLSMPGSTHMQVRDVQLCFAISTLTHESTLNSKVATCERSFSHLIARKI